MKQLVKIAMFLPLTFVFVGCTTVQSPTGWKYSNFGFQKTFSELRVETNGTMVVKGYVSDATKLAEAVATGVASGLKP